MVIDDSRWRQARQPVRRVNNLAQCERSQITFVHLTVDIQPSKSDLGRSLIGITFAYSLNAAIAIDLKSCWDFFLKLSGVCPFRSDVPVGEG